MGAFVNGVYVPVLAETGWDAEVSDFLSRSGEEHINVKQLPYGAVGDGSHDDTAALTLAIAAAAAGTGTVYFPPGTYKITSTIVLDTYQNVRFIGAGGLAGSGFAGPLGPGAIIDARTITTGAAFSYDGAVDNQTATHFWENIYLRTGRTGWKYVDTARVVFQNYGVRSYTNDGNADNTGILLVNCFWFDFSGGTHEAPSFLRPSVILRGQTAALDTTSTYLITFLRCRFTFGAVHYEWNAGAASPGSAIFRDTTMESSHGLPLFKVIESGSHSATFITGVQMFDCGQFDQSASAALVEIDTPNATLQRPVLIHCFQGVGNPGILVTNGSVEMARMMGGTNTQLGSFVMDSSNHMLGQIRDRDHGTDHVETADVTDVASTDMTNRSGPFWRFGKNSDQYARFGMSVDGAHYWGPGGSTNTGWDASLIRTGTAFLTLTGSLKTNSGFVQRNQVLTDQATVATDASTGSIFQLATSSNRTIGAPTNGTAGQIIHYRIHNNGAGSISTSWNGVFALAGGSWNDPAAGKRRMVSFFFDGGTWYEMARSSGDL